MIEYKDKIAVVFGSAGYLGTAVTEELLKRGAKVRAVGRNESKLFELQQKFPSIEVWPGDIANPYCVKRVMEGAHQIYNLAANKVVNLSEKFVQETIDTNITGVSNILKETTQSKTVESVVFISTDKAAQPTSLYGCSKRLSEGLMRQYEELNPGKVLRTVRYGNVLGSSMSLLPILKDRIQRGLSVTINSEEATRFFWKVESAVSLIFEALEKGKDASPYCPTMKSMNLKELFEVMIDKYSGGKKIEIIKGSMTKAENLHEKMLDEGPYSNEVELYTKQEIFEMV